MRTKHYNFDAVIAVGYPVNLTGLSQAFETAFPRTTRQTFEAEELGNQYPGVVRIWRNSWDRIIPFSTFSPAMRKLLYTTNAIESLNRSIRKVVKTKVNFGNDDAVRKLVWLTQKRIAKKITEYISPDVQATVNKRGRLGVLS